MKTKGKNRFIIYVVVLVQSVLLSLSILHFLGAVYDQKMESYLENEATKIYITNTPEEKAEQIARDLKRVVDEEGLFLLTKQYRSNSLGEGREVTLFGVYGDAELVSTPLAFLNKEILTKENLSNLLKNEKNEATIGVDKGSVDSIGDVPELLFSSRLVVKKFQSLIEERESVNGVYEIMGLTSQEKREAFLTKVSTITHISKEDLVAKSFGVISDGGLMALILLVVELVVFLILVVFCTLRIVQAMNLYGSLSLLGWKRWELLKALYTPMTKVVLCVTPLFLGIGYFISRWQYVSTELLSLLFLGQVLNVLLFLFAVLLGSALLFSTKPIQAIRRQLPMKKFLVAGAVLYVLLSVFVCYAGIALDSPMRLIAAQKSIVDRWTKVKEVKVLGELKKGNDEASFGEELSNKMQKDIYHWYQTVEGKEGMYLVNTGTYLQEEFKDGSFGFVPDKDYWEFIVSPNYLADKMHLSLSKENLKKTQEGTRTYLFPSTMSKKDRENFEKLIHRDSTGGLSEGDIPTVFNKERVFLFLEYTPKEAFFTWGRKEGEAIETKDPIIYVATSENMTFFETESLAVTGLDGYFKFENESLIKEMTSKKVLEKYNLADNAPSFLSVEKYIDGITKPLYQLLEFLIGLFGIAVLILCSVIVGVTTMYRLANQEKIHVKKFLGFRFWQIYKVPLLFILAVNVLSLGTTIIVRSTLGTIFLSMSAIIQGVVFYRYSKSMEIKALLKYFKA